MSGDAWDWDAKRAALLSPYLAAWRRVRGQIAELHDYAPEEEEHRSVETVLLLVDEVIDNCEALIEDLTHEVTE